MDSVQRARTYWFAVSTNMYVHHRARAVMRGGHPFVSILWHTKSILKRWKTFIVLVAITQSMFSILFITCYRTHRQTGIHWLFVSSFIIDAWPTFQCIGAFHRCTQMQDEQHYRTHTHTYNCIPTILICAKFSCISADSTYAAIIEHHKHCIDIWEQRKM